VCGRFEAAQARALRVEQPRRFEHGRAVFEQREQFDGAREALEQGARKGAGCGAVAYAFVGQRADGGEGVREVCARSLAVRGQARDVAAVEAAAGDEQVFAGAARQPAQLQLARGGAVVGARVGAGERQPREALDAFARGEQRVARRFVREQAGAAHGLLGVAQGVDRLALRALDPAGIGNVIVLVVRD